MASIGAMSTEDNHMTAVTRPSRALVPQSLAALTVAIALGGCAVSTKQVTAPSAAEASAAFERLKLLEGTWNADTESNGEWDTQVIYRVLGAGSVVTEDLFPGAPHAMVTVYHLDGARLLGTHYCAAGNQPRMAADKINDHEIAFELVDVTNLAGPDAAHMNSVAFEFIDADHVTTRWGSVAAGKPADPVEFVMTRVKEKPVATPTAESDFIILMYEDDNAWAKMSKAEQDDLMGKYMAWVGDLRERGIFRSGAPCGSKQVLLSADATKGGAITEADHAPTKDVLTGFFVVRAASLNDAIAIAKTCPSLSHGERIIVRSASHD